MPETVTKMAMGTTHHHTHPCQNRFKVVKIESRAPFKRGRWICMDYYDQPSHTEVSNEDQSSSNSSNTGSSIAAIDNKIEQAMDLVKSHLMFAVREEVDVLKEKIAELTDKISRLEMENLILRNDATPETLTKCNIQLQLNHLQGQQD